MLSHRRHRAIPAALGLLVASSLVVETFAFDPIFHAIEFSRSGRFGICREDDSVEAATIRLETGESPGLAVLGVVHFTIELSIYKSAAEGVTTLPPRRLTDDEVELVYDTFRSVSDNLGGPLSGCGAIDPCFVNEFDWDYGPFSDAPCAEPRATFEQTQVLLELLETLRTDKPGGPFVANGDANGDGDIDISDAMRLLLWQFRGGEPPVDATCPLDLQCAGRHVTLENGDVNADRERNVSDAVYLLGWLFLSGPAPSTLCFCEPL